MEKKRKKTGDGSNRRRKKGCIFLLVRASLSLCLAVYADWMDADDRNNPADGARV